MAPAKMHRYLKSIYGELTEKNIELSIQKSDELLKLKTSMVETTERMNEKTTVTSYLVSCIINLYLINFVLCK